MLDEADMWDTAEEVRVNSLVMYFCGSPLMFMQGLDDQLEPIDNSSVLIRDVARKTCRKRWTRVPSGKRGSGKSVLAARHDDDDDNGIRDCLSSSTFGFN